MIRIGYACKLLIEDKYSITYICYESEYNYLSNSNKQYKLITGTIPYNFYHGTKTSKAKK